MTNKTSQNERFLEEMIQEDFAMLSGEERLRRLMQRELEGLSGKELAARVGDITKRADDFVKTLRLSHATAPHVPEDLHADER